jgi:hypothetical protein
MGNAERYQQEAAQARELAKETCDTVIRDAFLKVAQEYDAMAAILNSPKIR